MWLPSVLAQTVPIRGPPAAPPTVAIQDLVALIVTLPGVALAWLRQDCDMKGSKVRLY